VVSGVLATLCLVASCSDGDDTTASTAAVAAPSSSAAQRVDDGVLTIGLLRPVDGAALQIGEGLAGGARLAIADINGFGGVNGSFVRLIERDEPADLTATRAEVANLIALGADVIIGPSRSPHAVAIAPSIVSSGVLACLPTATSALLDEMPDNGLMFRTIPSDRLQADALALVTERSGATRAIVVFVDDPYGRPLAELTARALEDVGVDVVAQVGAEPSGADIDQTARAVVAADGTMVVMIGEATTGPLLVQSIDRLGDGRFRFVVNDAMRVLGSGTPRYGSELATKVSGVSPTALPSSSMRDALVAADPDRSTLFASNAYDCITIAALAAQFTGSDDPLTLAAAIPQLTSGGTSCASFSTCVDAADSGLNVQYDGPNGELEIDARGELGVAVFDVFGYDAEGRDISTSAVRVNAR
jgi:branched-chain amino acid transport system substrate-binding protein